MDQPCLNKLAKFAPSESSISENIADARFARIMHVDAHRDANLDGHRYARFEESSM